MHSDRRPPDADRGGARPGVPLPVPVSAALMGCGCLLTLLFLANPAGAQPAAQKLGAPITVNYGGNPVKSAVAVAESGNFVVAWSDYSTNDVFVRVFDALGNGQSPVTAQSTAGGFSPDVAMDKTEKFVVVFNDNSARDGSLSGTFAQRFDASGGKIGSDFQVNTSTSGHQANASIAMEPDGDFVVVWSGFSSYDSSGVAGQRFDATGNKLGGEFRVNTTTTATQTRGSVTVDPTGNFVVTWDNYLSTYSQRFDSAGAKQGSEVAFGYGFGPVPDSTVNGDFVIAWSSDSVIDTDGDGRGVAVRRYDVSGSPLGAGLFHANTYTTGNQYSYGAAQNDSGEFIVVWVGKKGGAYFEVFGRFFDPSGNALGSEFPASPSGPLGNQFRAAADIDAAGNFVVSWKDYGSGEILAQRFLAPCREELAVTANQWHLISLPCEPDAAADTVADVFGDDLPVGGYGLSWVLYRRNASTDSYEQVGVSDSLEMGRGYWFTTILSGVTVDVEGHNADYSCAGGSEFNTNGGCVESPALFGDAGDCSDGNLADGRFNMLGYPFRVAQMPLAGLRINDNGTERSLQQAEAANVASDQMWTWNGAAYQASDSCTPGLEGELNPWDGAWLDVCTLSGPSTMRFPARPATGCGPPPPPAGPERQSASDSPHGSRAFAPGGNGGGGGGGKPRKDDAWYLRLVASADGMSDPGNVLGEIATGALGYDSHDLIELQPFGSNWLTIVFPHTDWGADANEWYTSDYHGFDDPRQWSFEVRSNASRSVTLTWELTGEAKLLRRMELVDEATGATIPGEDGAYTFTMTAASHALTWREAEKGGGPPRK